MDVLCIFKIMIERKNLEHGCTKNQWPYANQDQVAKPQSGASSPKSGLKRHACLLHLHNQDRESTFGTWVYQRPVTISKWRLRSRTPVGNSSLHQIPKLGLKEHGCSLSLQKQDREPKFGIWMYQRPVTISKSKSRCQTPVRNLYPPPKPQIMT